MKPVNDPSHTGVDAKLETLRRDVPPRNDLWPRIAAQLEANQVERDASLGRHGPARRHAVHRRSGSARASRWDPARIRPAPREGFRA